MGYSDITSNSVTSGSVAVTNNPMILVFIAGLACVFFLFKNKRKIKSGVGLINFSISPRNEKIAIGLGCVALSMYGLDLYLKYKDSDQKNDSD